MRLNSREIVQIGPETYRRYEERTKCESLLSAQTDMSATRSRTARALFFFFFFFLSIVFRLFVGKKTKRSVCQVFPENPCPFRVRVSLARGRFERERERETLRESSLERLCAASVGTPGTCVRNQLFDARSKRVLGKKLKVLPSDAGRVWTLPIQLGTEKPSS